MIVLEVNLVKAISILKYVFLKNYVVFMIDLSLAHQNMFDPRNLVWTDYHLAISVTIKQQMIGLGIPVMMTRFEGYDSVLKEGLNSFSYTLGDIHGFRNAVTKYSNIP